MFMRSLGSLGNAVRCLSLLSGLPGAPAALGCGAAESAAGGEKGFLRGLHPRVDRMLTGAPSIVRNDMEWQNIV